MHASWGRPPKSRTQGSQESTVVKENGSSSVDGFESEQLTIRFPNGLSMFLIRMGIISFVAYSIVNGCTISFPWGVGSAASSGVDRSNYGDLPGVRNEKYHLGGRAIREANRIDEQRGLPVMTGTPFHIFQSSVPPLRQANPAFLV